MNKLAGAILLAGGTTLCILVLLDALVRFPHLLVAILVLLIPGFILIRS